MRCTGTFCVCSHYMKDMYVYIYIHIADFPLVVWGYWSERNRLGMLERRAFAGFVFQLQVDQFFNLV